MEWYEISELFTVWFIDLYWIGTFLSRGKTPTQGITGVGGKERRNRKSRKRFLNAALLDKADLYNVLF